MSVRQVEKLIKKLQEDDAFLENWGKYSRNKIW